MKPYTAHAWRNRNTAPSEAAHERAISPARHWMLGGVLALGLVGVGGRLAYWQIGQHAQLAAMAGEQQRHALLVPALRGTITDRNGVILALTVTEDAVVADPIIVQGLPATQREALVQQLSAITQVAPEIVRAQLALPTGYHILTDASGVVIHLPPDVAHSLQAQLDAGALPGITLQAQSWREYPSGQLASQVLGFVQADSGQGQYGIEAGANGWLAGRPGRVIASVDVYGQPLANAPSRIIPSLPGADLALTLDANLQAMAEQGLQGAVAQTGATGGTVIIEDPQTGEILALANAPTFDPNAYGNASMADFLNPAISAVYDPGSTMKAITMAAGIDTGVITPETAFDDPGVVTVAGQTIANWNHLAWGNETMTQVLQHSSNVGAAWVALHVGHDRFDHYLTSFGFGSATGVPLAGEVPGLLAPQEPTPALANLDLAENAFGESIGVTPLQLVMAYGALANGGQLMRPQILAAMTRDGQTRAFAPQVVRQVVSPQTAATVTQMLVQSSQHSEALTCLIPNYAVAAKTGTSTPDPKNPALTYASVIGYAPADHPRFVVLVKLDHPHTNIFGGGAAGPLWRALVRQLLAYYHIPPSGGQQ